MEKNNINTEVRKELAELHAKMVGLVWDFCSRNCQNAEFFDFSVDGIEASVKYDDKGCGTDSAISIKDKENNILIESF